MRYLSLKSNGYKKFDNIISLSKLKNSFKNSELHYFILFYNADYINAFIFCQSRSIKGSEPF